MLRSLHKIGVRPYVLIKRSRMPLIAWSRYKGRTIYYKDVYEIIDILKQYFSKELYPPVLICCDDDIQAIVDNHYDVLKEYFILANIAETAGQISKMMSKQAQMELAGKCGIDIPQTWKFKRGDLIPNDVVYPCFIKADSSLTGGKSEMHICSGKEELQTFINERDYIVQEYIQKDYEITIWGTSIGANEYYFSGVGRKIRQFPNDRGLSSFCSLECFDAFPGLDVDGLKGMMKCMSYTGMFNIEMAVKDDKYYLLEINLRNGGKQHFSTEAGANLPELYISSQLGIPVDLPVVNYPSFFMGGLYDYHHIGQNGLTVWQWMHDLFKTRAFFIFNILDPLPFAVELITKIKDTFRFRFGLVK